MSARDVVFRYQYLKRHTATTGSPRQQALASFADRFIDVAPFSITHAEYQRLSPPKKASQKAGNGAYIAAVFDGPSRATEAIRAITAFTYDFDALPPDMAERLLDPASRRDDDPLNDIWHIAHTTRSHLPDDPHVRLLIPVAPESAFPADEKPALSHWLAKKLGLDEFVDRTCYRPAQIMFFPTRSADQEYRWHVSPDDVPLLDADALRREVLASYPTLDDVLLDDDVPLPAPSAGLRDPRERPGPPGVFNAWMGDVETAIERFLDEVYEFVEPGRYRHRSSTGAAGAVVLSDGQRLYSHHGTDPASGRARDAFDLVRIHRFGELDTAVPQNPDDSTGTAYTTLPSYTAMLEWLNDQDNPDTEGYRKELVRREQARWDELLGDDAPSTPSPLSGGRASKALARLFPGRVAPAAAAPGSAGFDPADRLFIRRVLKAGVGLDSLPWEDDPRGYRQQFTAWVRERMAFLLEKLERRKDGQPKPESRANVLLVLQHHPLLRAALRHDATQPPRLLFDTAWVDADGILGRVRPGDSVDREYASCLATLLAAPPANHPLGCGVTVGRQAVLDILTQHSLPEQDADPVRYWLEDLRWDGKERLHDLLPRFFGSPESPYYREVGRVFFRGAARRILKPGSKFDYMLIIPGEQGVGKSTFARLMAPSEELFTTIEKTDPRALESKAIIEEVADAVVVEFPELAGLRHATVESIKSFISRQEDTARTAYARFAITRPRRFVAIGTTNDQHLFSDDTGNRRFLVAPMTKQFDVEDFLGIRDQLWAEARELALADDEWELPVELRAEQNELTGQYRIPNPVEAINDYVAWGVFRASPLREYGLRAEQRLRLAVKAGLLEPGVAERMLDQPGWFGYQSGASLDARLATWEPWRHIAPSVRGRATLAGRWLAETPFFRHVGRLRLGGVLERYHRALLVDYVLDEWREVAEQTGIIMRDWVPEEAARAWEAADGEWFGIEYDEGEGFEAAQEDTLVERGG